MRFQYFPSGTANFCLALTALLAAGALAAPARRTARPAGRPPAPTRAEEVSAGNKLFVERIKPLLQNNCLSCHAGEKPQGGLRVTSREALLRGGASGPALRPGEPQQSLLIAAVNHQGRKMPPSGRLPQAQINALAEWVRLGAPWPGGAQASLESGTHTGPPAVDDAARRFWAFRPVTRPAVPTPRRRGWALNPVDSFVLARLEREGLAPNPPADRATLIRRATYDLTGLPPTPEEVRAFLADTAPGAWERLVDRLLASPHYGEKWGRHWLDLVRYAESNSYERDGTKPEAWRYRDYVIRAFNEDKPYDQFVLEQLAGDELPDRTPEKLIATGYYRLGIWDDEPVDPEQALYDDLDDIVSTTGQVFLGLTVGCARCHDHKLDPLPQRDYYRFLAFFNGIRRYGLRSPESVAEASLRPISPPEVVARYREAVQAHLARVRANDTARAALEARVLPDFEPVEKEEFQNEEARPRLLGKRVPRLLSQAEYERYLALREERQQLQRFRPPAMDQALAVTEVGPKPRETYLLARGNPHARTEPVTPGFFSVLSPPEPRIEPPAGGESSGRRLALARWIVSPENPLTARVLANRLWHYHFGRGLVRSTSNFGFQGDKPTHPELLDWLAAELTAGGWHLKRMHRLLMLSATYRMSSRGQPAALAADPENDYLWRFDMRRLLAEEVRDSILAVNGSLNLRAGGPSIFPDLPAEVLAGQSMPGAGWGKSSPEEQRRRSVYIFVKRSLMTPVLASFDAPEPDFSCSARFATTQPTQALGLLNSAWLNQQAEVLAALLRREAGPEPRAQVRLALWRVLQREPTEAELARGVRLIAELRRGEGGEPGMSAEQALHSFCVVALNLNEFLYLD